MPGNLHLLFAQGFDSRAEQERYGAMMDELCAIVATKYGGSLKAEHGTGRNVAPFVEMEWGKDGYALMKDIKKAFDPHHLLNPGTTPSPCHTHVHRPHDTTHASRLTPHLGQGCY